MLVVFTQFVMRISDKLQNAALGISDFDRDGARSLMPGKNVEDRI